jgi:hypothetical protein
MRLSVRRCAASVWMLLPQHTQGKERMKLK